jgi:hypothetical protein
MGKPMYNFAKNVKEKARQKKQMEKASKRLIAKQSKDNMTPSTPNEESDKGELITLADITKGTE